MNEELTQRQREILKIVVKDYIQTARPVGSHYLARHYNLGLSPATVRNTLADLEKKGYLTHLYTSSGRIPTDKGYRFYVDSICNIVNISTSDRISLESELSTTPANLDQLLRITSRLLGKLSEELGIVLAPRFYKGILSGIDLLELSSEKLLVVIYVESGLVKTVVLEVESEIPHNHLPMITALLNERLVGRSISEIKRTIDDRFQDIGDVGGNIIHIIIENAQNLFSFSDFGTIHLDGALQLLKQPEFQDPQRLSDLIQVLDDNQWFINLLQYQSIKDEPLILIGSENIDEEATEFSIIASEYQFGDLEGVLAVFGPKRMPYERIIPIVQYTAELVSNKLQMEGY
jgi:heat-inducible transcriptional repressor